MVKVREYIMVLLVVNIVSASPRILFRDKHLGAPSCPLVSILTPGMKIIVWSISGRVARVKIISD